MAQSVSTAALLGNAWAALGGDPDLLASVEVTGDDEGLLPSSLEALPAMLAAVSASTLAASVLDAARAGARTSPVRVDAEHVAVAARSERYARRDGADEAELFAPLSRFWRTGDGWLRLHANYAWHRERALSVLGCGDRAQDVEEAIGEWRSEDLEDALAAAGALGFAVRTLREWREHPHGSAVASLPLLDSTAGTAPGRRTTPARVAAGLRVLDLTRVIAGPVATRTLAAWGADVLRIDSPHLPEIPAQALDTLPGKRSAQLDLSEPAGRMHLQNLLGRADVLVQGYRPGALARYGLGPEDLAERYPHLSVVTISAWGPVGPWAARRGFDSLVQCPTGIAAAEGTDDAPGALPAQVLDHATGYLAAAAAALAVAGVQRGEPARSCRLSLAQTAQWLISAGRTVPRREREVQPEDYLLSLPGAAQPAHVVSPPGMIGDRRPGWSRTTDLGADQPAFY
ncbi:MAG: CoA transferase [Actinomycetota bacterium]|nr:CoA transferase [Actinomycetota bacterium]